MSSLKTLIEHRTGTGWAKVTSPNPSTRGDQLLGVAALTSIDAWAVGYYATGSGHRTLIEHWNGTAWSVK